MLFKEKVKYNNFINTLKWKLRKSSDFTEYGMFMLREKYIQFVCVQDHEGVTHYF